jgi:hypothetical protein
MLNNGKFSKIKTFFSSQTFMSFFLLFLSIIVHILLCAKNISTFSFFEEDYYSLYFTDPVVRIDEKGRVWCDCKESERTSCKIYGPFILRECAPTLSLKIANNEIPILLAPHIGASGGLLLKLYIKTLEKIGFKPQDMKKRIILFRSFGIILRILLGIILIFIITSKIFGHPSAGISSALLSTNIILVYSNYFSAPFLPTEYLPLIALLTISLAVSFAIAKIRIKTKVILISTFVLTLLISPFLFYQIKYSENWFSFKFVASPLKYALYRLIPSPENIIKNFLINLMFIFTNMLPEPGKGWWVLTGSGQNYTFSMIRTIFISLGFLNFIISEKNQKIKLFLLSLFFSYVFLLSLFDVSAHHSIFPSIILYIACAKGIAELKIRFKNNPIPLYIPFTLLLILFSSIGIIINSKKIIEANPDKLLEPKLKVVEFLMKNNIKRVVELSHTHHIPIGILTDGKIKVVSYSLLTLQLSQKPPNDINSIVKLLGRIFSLEKNSVFIGDKFIQNIYRLVKLSGFDIKELFRISVGQYYLVVFTIE